MNALNFVKIWNSVNSIDDVVQQTGLTRGACHARASTYRRKHNIELQQFESARTNWAMIAAVAKEVTDAKAETTEDTSETSDQT